MVCDGCSSRVEETLAKMAGVKKVGQALLTGAALCRAPSSASGGLPFSSVLTVGGPRRTSPPAGTAPSAQSHPPHPPHVSRTPRSLPTAAATGARRFGQGPSHRGAGGGLADGRICGGAAAGRGHQGAPVWGTAGSCLRREWLLCYSLTAQVPASASGLGSCCLAAGRDSCRRGCRVGRDCGGACSGAQRWPACGWARGRPVHFWTA